MEVPRDEMEIVDAAGTFGGAAFDPWAQLEGDLGDDSWGDWHVEEVVTESASGASVETAGETKPGFSVVAASIKTAATLERESAADASGAASTPLPRVSPDVFKQGMTVTHPEYGPGKIVALSGSGKNRRATIQFATVGQKKIILAHSTVRPVG
jgi:DNA helicase-2/ATP-dependent DNA helicase PcrA